jgi:hypothetical protein
VTEFVAASLKTLYFFCDGRKEVPWPELDRLIQLIIREQGKLIAKNRELLVRTRARHEQAKNE